MRSLSLLHYRSLLYQQAQHLLPNLRSYSRFSTQTVYHSSTSQQLRDETSSSSIYAPSIPVVERLAYLRSKLHESNQLYYGDGKSKIRDEEYDNMMRELTQLESANPELLTADSPSLIVGHSGAGSISSAPIHIHGRPMLSLNNTNADTGILAFLDTTQRLLASASQNQAIAPDILSYLSSMYVMELKYDGMAVSLLYRAGRFIKAVTRGDGNMGEDITMAVKRLVSNLVSVVSKQSVIELLSDTKTAHMSQKDKHRLEQHFLNGEFEIRGEIVMTKAEYEAYLSEHREEEDDTGVRSARNLIVGLLRTDWSEKRKPLHPRAQLQLICYSLHLADDPSEAAAQQHKRSQRHFPPSDDYASTERMSAADLSTDPAMHSLVPSLSFHAGRLSLLSHLSFPICPNAVVISDHQGLLDIYHKYDHERDSLPIDIDGIVIKLNYLPFHNILSSTAHHPRWALACKFNAATGTSTVLSIRYQIGRTGKAVPVADVDKILIGGVNIERVNLHNTAWMRKMGIKQGSVVEIERKGDVIPQIVRVLPASSSSSSLSASMSSPLSATQTPSPLCPCFEACELLLEEDDYYCVSPSCPVQLHRRLLHYCSRAAMNITSLGPATLQMLLGSKHLTSLQDLPLLAMTDKASTLQSALLNSPGWKSKSISNLLTGIRVSHRDATDVRMLIALGISGVGEEVAKRLISVLGDLDALRRASVSQLQRLHGIGAKNAQHIWDGLQAASPVIDTMMTVRKQLRSQDVHTQAQIETHTQTQDTAASHSKSGNISPSPSKKTSAFTNIVSSRDSKSSVTSDPALPTTLQGLSFVLTGTLSQPREVIVKMIQERGGEVEKQITYNTDYLVVGESERDTPSAKTKQASKKGVTTIDEPKLQTMLNNNAQA